MYSQELIQKQKAWAESGLFLLRELLPLMGAVGRHEWTKEQGRTLGYLLSASARSSESAMLLCAYGQLWDAEVVARSVLEGSLKFAYLLQSKTDFEERFRQYSQDLFQIGLLKDHQKAVDFLDAIPDADAPDWQPIRDMLMPDEQQADIRSQFSSSARRALEMQWSFAGLLRALTSGEAGFVGLKGLAHGYSIASHIQHADYAGTSIVLDRDLRSPERRDAIHLAHLAKMISSVLECLLLRLGAGYQFIGHDRGPLKTAAEKIEAVRRSFGTPYEDWIRVEYGATATSTENRSDA